MNFQEEKVLQAYEEQSQGSIYLQEAVCLAQKPEEVRNKKWSDQEHILYILFLEFNREKTKSKLIRRSNSFYKEMSIFVKSKNGIQCRSHHQKYETKHRFPHRIIREEKNNVSYEQYIKTKNELMSKVNPKIQDVELEETPKAPVKEIAKKKNTGKEIACQTDLFGVNNHIEMWEGDEPRSLWENLAYQSPQMVPSLVQQPWLFQNQQYPPWAYPFY